MTRVVLVVAAAVGWPAAVPGQTLTVRRQAAGEVASGHTGAGFFVSGFNAPAAAADTLGAYTSRPFTTPYGSAGTYTAAGNGFGVFNDGYGGSVLANGTRDNYFSTGNRPLTPGGTDYLHPSATLSLSATAYYLGIHWMAVDDANTLRFYRGGVGGTLVGTVTAGDVLADVGVSAGTAYNGVVRRAADGSTAVANAAEKYVYLNVYAPAGQGFDTVVFDNGNAGSGFESDNHTVAFNPVGAADQIGVVLVPVPEPAGLLAVAGGLLLLRRRA